MPPSGLRSLIAFGAFALAAVLPAVLAGPVAAVPDAAAPAADAGAAPDAPPGEGPSPSAALRARAAAFARFRAPTRGSAEAVGAYANGCVIGAVGLPTSGPNYEVLHLERNRRYGHPTLVAYLRRLALAAKKAGIGPLLIGDLSQPRGGPAPFGHRSHQTGLDADVGFSRPSFLLTRKLTPREREDIQPPAVVDLKTRKLTSVYGPKVERLIELAARDAAVERVFVNPHIKEALCKRAPKGAARAWLRVVRPWTAHHDHLHVRLKCPAGSSNCDAQAAVAPGDGCDEVERWIADEERPREPPPPPSEPPKPPRPPPPLPPLPAQCQALIDQDSAAVASDRKPVAGAAGSRAAGRP